MISRSTLLHLRIPFSFFLLPVFFFAALEVDQPTFAPGLLVFFILHLLVYPASNGYNSYYDKDEDSIGGLEKPPPVSKELLYVSLAMDTLALLLALFLGYWFALGILIYGLVSKSYSNDQIRLKKYPILGWLVVGFFQGAFVFWTVYLGCGEGKIDGLFSGQVLMASGLSTLLLLGSYPMTQVYQHKEDKRRGDMTLSRLLGVKGTFLFTMTIFGIASALYFLYFFSYHSLWTAVLFEISLLPVLIYFFLWFFRVWKDESKADFKSTMRLNLISGICLNLFFAALMLVRHSSFLFE